MNDDMTEKYQQHYNQILSGTLNDMMLKNISFQANIKLANEIISDQDKELIELKSVNDNLKKEIENLKSGAVDVENSKILALENNIKSNMETINRLNNEVAITNRMKLELESLKNQASNADTYRNELVKERENHENTKLYYESKLRELNEKIELLESPLKKKKNIKVNKEFEITENVENILSLIRDDKNNNQTIKDGGTF